MTGQVTVRIDHGDGRITKITGRGYADHGVDQVLGTLGVLASRWEWEQLPAEDEARHEVECPSCATTIRARMADASPNRAAVHDVVADLFRTAPGGQRLGDEPPGVIAEHVVTTVLAYLAGGEPA